MDAADVSYDLLAHFDDLTEQHTPHEVPTRGVGWVLQWAAAWATLFVAAGLLAEFGYCLAAELALTRAARAGVLEATLPRATERSVAAAIERRLTGYPSLANRLRFSLQHHGAPVRGALGPGDGERLSVTLAVQTDAVLPHWLRTVSFWRSDSQIEVRAERQMPGRSLMRSSTR